MSTKKETTPTKKVKSVTYEVKAGDTIQSIAVRFDVDWKILAQSNNIKEPYVIKKGQKLKLLLLTDL